jgi:3D (Asp-Asp-Asp) domain-containing protein
MTTPLGGTAALAAALAVAGGMASPQTPVTAAAGAAREEVSRPGAVMQMSATAYCVTGRTRSGTPVRRGIVAADPDVLPVGSILSVEAPDERLSGLYSVLDTGPAVQGHEIDIFIRDCREAREFGRQPVRIRVLRLGWDPQASAD